MQVDVVITKFRLIAVETVKKALYTVAMAMEDLPLQCGERHQSPHGEEGYDALQDEDYE
jgi:hypothetical protein